MTRALVAELVGTAMLLTAVVGSGIMGERLAGGNVAIALLANTLATAAILLAAIMTLGPVSGAHFNPLVSLADASQGGLRWKQAGAYGAAQTIGAVLGVAIAHYMFEQPAYAWSHHAHNGPHQFASEAVATFGLFSVIWGCSRRQPALMPFAVAAYIASAYWFTASTSFANPAVTIARSLTDTFSGIQPSDVPPFLVAQAVGAVFATVLFRWLVPASPTFAKGASPPLPRNADVPWTT